MVRGAVTRRSVSLNLTGKPHIPHPYRAPMPCTHQFYTTVPKELRQARTRGGRRGGRGRHLFL